MSNASIEMARTISAMVPAKPKSTLLGGEAHRQEMLAYGTAMAAAVAAWKYAAHLALNAAQSAALDDQWYVDDSNRALIDGWDDIKALEAMCDPQYPWTGRRADQL